MAHAEDAAQFLHVEVAYCPRPGVTDLVALTLAAGATLADALLASGMLERHGLEASGLRTGVWGRVAEAATPLRERDRVEIYRGLLVDPKEARRQRYKQHRESAAARAAAKASA